MATKILLLFTSSSPIPEKKLINHHWERCKEQKWTKAEYYSIEIYEIEEEGSL